MKTILILIVCTMRLLGSVSVNWSEENRRIEAEQVALWEGKLALAKQKPPLERSADLWLGLRNMGYRKNYDGHSLAVDAIYQSIQREILSIPGHAQYFADEIEREQKAVEKYPTCTGPRVSYDRQRALYFETLCHLPSPETIAVLGHFLHDDTDTPVPLVSPDSDWGENPRANSYFSSGTIISIGLRNPPVESQRRNVDPDILLAETRAWWEEIKSGKRTFSFIGHKVEYRFKSDGTWDTIALADLPDDAPKPQRAADGTQGRLLNKTLSSQTANGKQIPWNSWAWIIGAVIALLALVFWLKVKYYSRPD
jgi:hypothetical protein